MRPRELGRAGKLEALRDGLYRRRAGFAPGAGGPGRAAASCGARRRWGGAGGRSRTLHVRTLSAENRLVCLLNRLVCLLNRLVCLLAIFSPVGFIRPVGFTPACWQFPACSVRVGNFSGLLAIPGGPMLNTLNDDAHPNPNPTRRTRARVPTRTHPCRWRPLNPVASPALRPTGSTCSGSRTCAAAPRRRRSARAPSSSKRGRCTGRPPCA